jgi:hypothetical protein
VTCDGLCHGNQMCVHSSGAGRRASCSRRCCVPLRHRLGSEATPRRAGKQMTLDIEDVVDGGVGREKALRGSSRFEPLQLALSSADRLVGVLAAIVPSQAPLVAADEVKIPERGGVGAQLVGYDHGGAESVFLEELANQLQRGGLVPLPPDQDVQHFAFVIDGAPDIALPSSNHDHHLVEVPL